jgi:(2R)-3-sulfolactate dehydrogenase (NADP+)
MGLPAEALARQGFVALAFTNSPAAMPVPGGRRPLLGTNPVAAAFPRRGATDPLVVDLALSKVARGRIMVAAKEGRPIPPGWAIDAAGEPTTDPQAALGGAMLAAGGTKGALLALVVELLCCALTGAAFGFEADGFFAEEGNRPRLGQAILAVDPGALAGREAFLDRVEALVGAMLGDDGVRLPGARRDEPPPPRTPLPDVPLVPATSPPRRPCCHGPVVLRPHGEPGGPAPRPGPLAAPAPPAPRGDGGRVLIGP